MTFKPFPLLAVFVSTLMAGAANAEPPRGAYGVPPGHLPPPGECRVWYDGVPPGQQPPPTDCRSARFDAWRTGGRVLYGSYRESRRYGRGWHECDERDYRKGEC